VIINTTGTITNDVGAAGSQPNSRDQFGAFSSSSWIHLYWIGTPGGTLATLSSLTALQRGQICLQVIPIGLTSELGDLMDRANSWQGASRAQAFFTTPTATS
jgi:hypothetical protein